MECAYSIHEGRREYLVIGMYILISVFDGSPFSTSALSLSKFDEHEGHESVHAIVMQPSKQEGSQNAV